MSSTDSQPHQEAFSEEERAALKETAAETRKRRRPGHTRTDDEAEVLTKIAEMPEADRMLAERVHTIIRQNAPNLAPRTWYGMPAYANDAGKIICFFQPAAKFKARYATLGFNDAAALDKGAMWPTAFALTAMTSQTEEQITSLIRRAVS